MADSVIAISRLPSLSAEEIMRLRFPWKVRPDVDMRTHALAGRAKGCTYTIPGYAPETFFKATVLLEERHQVPCLVGYLLSFNACCVTGSNALLTNGVPKLCEIMLLLFKAWLLDQGCTHEGIDLLDVEDMQLVKATPTFLLDAGSDARALEASNDFARAAEIQNAKVGLRSGKNGKPIQPSIRVKTVSSETGRRTTTYVHARDHEICCYVKDYFAVDTKHHPDAASDAKIFGISNRMLRPGVELTQAWMKAKALTSVEDWRAYGDERAYKEAFAQMCRDLRLDENLRFRKPKGADLNGLGQVDREVLDWHLDDDDQHQARNHPAVLAKGDREASYFSDMKLRLLDKLRIDISIPWKKQVASAKAAAELRRLMLYPGLYRSSDELADQIFSMVSVPRIVRELQAKIEKRRQGLRSIGRILLHPDTLEPPTVELGRLSVSEQAHAHMKQHKIPKHHLFSAHRCGVFGDVSKEEVLCLAAAAAARDTVRSRYRVGDTFVTVTTRFTRHDGPVTRMALEAETAMPS